MIINTSRATLEWTVTFAVTGSEPIGAIDVAMAVEPCNGICECHGGCGCGDRCDCSGRFASDLAELECEPLVDATYQGSLDDDGRAHVALVLDEAVSAPADVLTCNYLSATEPSPSDFRVVVSPAAGPPAANLADRGEFVVARISLR